MQHHRRNKHFFIPFFWLNTDAQNIFDEIIRICVCVCVLCNSSPNTHNSSVCDDTIQVLLFNEQNYGIHYEYTIPADPTPEPKAALVPKPSESLFMWTHSGWEDCHAVCGGGRTHFREWSTGVNCVDCDCDCDQQSNSCCSLGRWSHPSELGSSQWVSLLKGILSEFLMRLY